MNPISCCAVFRCHVPGSRYRTRCLESRPVPGPGLAFRGGGFCRLIVIAGEGSIKCNELYCGFSVAAGAVPPGAGAGAAGGRRRLGPPRPPAAPIYSSRQTVNDTVGRRGFIRLRETTFILPIRSRGGGVLVMPDTQELVILLEKD